MQFIEADVVVLDPWQLIATDYRHHAPVPACFSLVAPYQNPGKHRTDPCQSLEGGEHAARDVGGRAAAVGLAAAAGAGERLEDGRHRKRKRSSSSYKVNKREQQAAVRHAAYAPQLAAAAEKVQAWLRASGAATVQQALAAAPAAAMAGQEQGRQMQQQQHEEEQHRRPARTPHHPVEGSGGSAPTGSRSSEGEGEGPDYLALYELRHVLKPKLQFAAGSVAAAAAAAGATGHAQHEPRFASGRHDVQRPQVQSGPTCNLFNRLIDCSCFSSSFSSSVSCCDGERLAAAGGHPVVLPPRSRFLLSDLRQLQPLLDDAAAHGGYRCIVLDPPWENKSAKRSARYPTLPSRSLLALPLRQLMHVDGCLVAIWVTNRERHRRFIDAELLPGWRLRHLATWHWLKITDGGKPVGRLDIQHRRPYESLLLCWSAHLPSPPSCPAAPKDVGTGGGGGTADGGFHLLQGRPLVVAAVPPTAHSRKPHLGPLLLPLLPDGARCLEMFARELHSEWTSWGNEVLKFHCSKYLRLRE